eukprot:3731681-Karenia_brevis.AAC.1
MPTCIHACSYVIQVDQVEPMRGTRAQGHKDPQLSSEVCKRASVSPAAAWPTNTTSSKWFPVQNEFVPTVILRR